MQSKNRGVLQMCRHGGRGRYVLAAIAAIAELGWVRKSPRKRFLGPLNLRRNTMTTQTKPATTSRVSGWSARHRWWVLAATALVIFMAAIVSGTVETVLQEDSGAEGESAIGSNLLDAAFNGEEETADQLLIQHTSLTVDDAEFRAVVDDAVEKLRAIPAVKQVTSFFETQDATLVSEDRHVVRVPVVGSPAGDIVDEVEAIADGAGGYVVSIAGPASLEYEDDRVMAEDLTMVLLVSLGAGMIILLIAFRSVVAALIPLATAMGAIFVTMAVAAVVSQAYALNELYAEMVLLMGLAVGIDYSLFLVARFRRERAAGREKYEAIEVASQTTGRAVSTLA